MHVESVASEYVCFSNQAVKTVTGENRLISQSISDYYSLTTWHKLALSTRLSGMNCDQVHVHVCALALVT